jgi:LuxR family maltose regulon positive regulatory protein
MRAEAHFNRGEVDGARNLAEKALNQAKHKQQECIIIGAALLLGRVAILKGDYDTYISMLKQIEKAQHNTLVK